MSTTKVTTKTTTSGTTAKGAIKPRDLSIDEITDACKSIENSIFKSNDEANRDWSIIMTLANSMAQYLVLYRFYPELFTDSPDYKDFFNDFYKGKYNNYVKALDGNMAYQIIMDFVETRKTILMAKLKNPMSDLLSELSSLLHNYGDKFKDIDADDFKKFVSEFGKFTEAINPESLTEVMLNKAKNNK